MPPMKAGADHAEQIELLTNQVRDLQAALGQNNENIANTFKLSPRMNNLLGLLLALPTVSAEIIGQRVGIASDPKVAMHRLRRELEPWREHLGKAHGEDIIHSKRLLGYWLDDATKARIRELIGAKGTPQVQEAPASNVVQAFEQELNTPEQKAAA